MFIEEIGYYYSNHHKKNSLLARGEEFLSTDCQKISIGKRRRISLVSLVLHSGKSGVGRRSNSSLAFFGIQDIRSAGERLACTFRADRIGRPLFIMKIFFASPTLPTYPSTDTRLGALLARLRASISLVTRCLFSLPFARPPARGNPSRLCAISRQTILK